MPLKARLRAWARERREERLRDEDGPVTSRDVVRAVRDGAVGVSVDAIVATILVFVGGATLLAAKIGLWVWVGFASIQMVTLFLGLVALLIVWDWSQIQVRWMLATFIVRVITLSITLAFLQFVANRLW